MDIKVSRIISRIEYRNRIVSYQSPSIRSPEEGEEAGDGFIKYPSPIPSLSFITLRSQNTIITQHN